VRQLTDPIGDGDGDVNDNVNEHMAAVAAPEEAGQALVQAGALPRLPGFPGGEVRPQVRVSLQAPYVARPSAGP